MRTQYFGLFPMDSKKVKRISRLSLLGMILILALVIFWAAQHGGEEPRPHRTNISVQWSDPAVKNNTDLVKYAQNALDSGWGYVYGTYGQVLKPELLKSCAEKYPSQIEPFLTFTKTNWMNGRVTDCAGLIKGYGWFNPHTAEITYLTNGMPDLSANGIEQAATEKGKISSIPEIAGLAVWMDGHIGIYIGNGDVIEASSAKKGVVKTKLQGRGWLEWMKIPSIRYGT